MPAVLHIINTYANTPVRRPAFLFSAAGLLFGATAMSIVGATHASARSGIDPLYPSAAPAIRLVDVPDLTVLEVIRKLPMTSRFDTLLANTNVRQQLTGTGPYTVFATANNYFDYLPKGAYISLTRAQEMEFAEHAVVLGSAIDVDSYSGNYITLAQDQVSVDLQDGTVTVGNGFAVRGYRASNGIVYVINVVLSPDDLASVLQ